MPHAPKESIPEQIDRPMLMDRAVDDLPIGFESCAQGFPEFKDSIHDDLDADGYQVIRRCFATGYPVRKLGLHVSSRRLQVKGEGPLQQSVQDVLDEIVGVRQFLEGMVWAIVEGVRFAWTTWHVNNEGWLIPRFHVKKKRKAGGRITWDGKTVIQIEDLALVGEVEEASPEETEARTLPRNRLVIWQPNDTGNPEGDTELAWWLYQLAEDATLNRKNRRQYGDRHGLPHEIIKKAIDTVRDSKVQQALGDAKTALEGLQRGQGVSMDARTAVELLETKGTTWQYLLQDGEDIRKMAHIAVLQQALTSETSSAGPTGSSQVHQSEEMMAVAAIAGSLAESITRDVLPEILNRNAYWLPEGMVDGIELEPFEEDQQPDKTVFDLYKEGEVVLSEELYAAAGATRPVGVPDIVNKPQPEPFSPFGPSPFGGGGGGFGGNGKPKSPMPGSDSLASPAGQNGPPKASGSPFSPENRLKAIRNSKGALLRAAWGGNGEHHA
ncbi:MAG: hypothetical protein GY835_22705 [bacterium]|nr:hypothetical protein [bacterium]